MEKEGMNIWFPVQFGQTIIESESEWTVTGVCAHDNGRQFMLLKGMDGPLEQTILREIDKEDFCGS